MDVDNEVLGIKGSAYLIGGWQREEYFAGSADVIRRDFTLKQPPDTRNALRLKELAEAQSVAVHVRRGDYVHMPRTATEYNVCDLNYYRRACERIAASVRAPRYFVFSDEPAWCREHMGFIPGVTIVDNNTPEQRHEDLRLMVACKHFIIANSSFSWWAAWLGTDPDKVVVAPSRWSVSNWFDVRKWIPSCWQLV